MMYILEDGKPVKVEDAAEWSAFMKEHNQLVEYTEVPRGRVSTVFLGVDHSFAFAEGAPPVLWETMFFPNQGEDEGQERYTSEEEAREGHWKWVASLAEPEE